MSTARDTAVLAGFRAGWSVVGRLPEGTAYRLFSQAADRLTAANGKGVQRLRSNYTLVRPDLDPDQIDRLVKAGMRSYLRYYCDAFRLASRTPEQIRESVVAYGHEGIRGALARGAGAVAFCGHLGNVDTSGAWAAQSLGPLTSVVERLEPEGLFNDFLAHRQRLGITVLPLTGGTNPFAGLREAIQRGDLVALAADRDLTSNGVEVTLCGHRARVAKGPALLSVTTGAPLFVAAVRYVDAPPGTGVGGKLVRIDFSQQITSRVEGTTAERVADLTQQCVDILGHTISTYTSNWHMLQRVFVADLREGHPRGSQA